MEDTFINPEIQYLKAYFQSIVFIPQLLQGNKINTPDPIKVDESLANILMSKGLIDVSQKLYFAVTSKIFYKELLKSPRITLKPKSIIKNIFFTGTAIIIKKWVERQIISNNIDISKTIFYTYWLDEITMGLCLAKVRYPEIIVVSRAHRGDLYEEFHTHSYIPYRPKIFNYLNKVFLDSEKGKDYLICRYPFFRSKFIKSLMGVDKQQFITHSSSDGIFRIVSCSNLVPVKRIDLLIKGLEKLGKLRSDQLFYWTHIGDGPLRFELEDFAKLRLPQNIKFEFLGFLINEKLLLYYKNNNIDVFVNVSSSEGTPVSIMEAQSCSIPVIATAVGGNQEIVTNDNGVLLSENPMPDEIANAIFILSNNSYLLKDKKKKSYENWNKYYNSEENYQLFVKKLISVLKQQNLPLEDSVQKSGEN